MEKNERVFSFWGKRLVCFVVVTLSEVFAKNLRWIRMKIRENLFGIFRPNFRAAVRIFETPKYGEGHCDGDCGHSK